MLPDSARYEQEDQLPAPGILALKSSDRTAANRGGLWTSVESLDDALDHSRELFLIESAPTPDSERSRFQWSRDVKSSPAPLEPVMRPIVTLSFVLLLALGSAAQTTGIPGFNDLLIDRQGSGATSGSSTIFVDEFNAVELEVDSAFPNSLLLIGLSDYFISPGAATLPSVNCGGVMAAQSFDLGLVPFATSNPLIFTAMTDGNGDYQIFGPALPVGSTYAVQAAVVTPGCSNAGVVFTQAHSIEVVFPAL